MNLSHVPLESAHNTDGPSSLREALGTDVTAHAYGDDVMGEVGQRLNTMQMLF